MTRLVLSAFIFLQLRLVAWPLWFEANQGQVHPSVLFLARSPNGYVYFGRNQMAVRDVGMELVGANMTARSELEQPLEGISSYFIGSTEKDWRTGIPHYGRLRYKDVYPGIDLVYYGNGRNLEYDFILQSNADPTAIRLAYNQPVHLDANGDLLIAGLRQKRPRVYQNGHEIACGDLIRDHYHIQLALAAWTARPAPISRNRIAVTLQRGMALPSSSTIRPRIDAPGVSDKRTSCFCSSAVIEMESCCAVSRPCVCGYFSLRAKRLYCPAGNCRKAKCPEASVTALRLARPFSVTAAFFTGSRVITSSTNPSIEAFPVWSG